MNTNNNAITILCYGDSNTWGQKDDKTGRYLASERWTGLLQNILGDGYYIIEEGLGSRTTDLDYDKKPGRNGRTYLAPCLASHNPIDVVAIMLGTNDLKIQYSRPAEDIARALLNLVSDVRQYAQTKSGGAPKIILISPILIDEEAPRFYEFYTGDYDGRAMQESHKLALIISKIAAENDCTFIDAASAARPGVDGIHFSSDSSQPMAKLMADCIKSLV